MAAAFDELYRDAVSLITHDLRGAASALALRADVLAGVLSQRDRDALKSLSNELLEIDNTLQLMQNVHTTRSTVSRSTGQRSTFAERTVKGSHWWQMTTRLSASVLPRGSRQNAQCDPIEITPHQASLFTYTWLSACKALASCTENAAHPIQTTLEFRSQSAAGDKPSMALSASAKFATLTAAEQLEQIEANLAQSRWLKYANRIARKNRAALSWWSRNETTFEWKCAM